MAFQHHHNSLQNLFCRQHQHFFSRQLI